MPPDNPNASASPNLPRGSSCLRPALTLVFLVVSALALLIMPGFIGLAFVLGGIVLVGLFAFHYLLWGRVLSMELQDPDQPRDDSDASSGCS